MFRSPAIPYLGRRRPRFRGGRAAALIALTGAVSLVAACGSSAGSTQSSGSGANLTDVSIVAFQAPSLGAFLPAVIEKQGLAAKHGLNIKYTYTTPDNYNSEFGAGHYDVGASAAVLSEDLRTQRGANVTYLFNLFDYWGTVVTSDSSISNLSGLSGHTLAAATGTTNYAMFQWFAKQEGLNLDQVKAVNQTTPGLSTMALSGRTDAVELWEPAYSELLAKKPSIQTINLDYTQWKKAFGTSDIPYLGVAAQKSWADQNPKAVQALYDTYLDASKWVTANPQAASVIIAKTTPGSDPKVIQQLIENNDQRLRMHVVPASDMTQGMQAVAQAGQQTSYLSKQ